MNTSGADTWLCRAGGILTALALGLAACGGGDDITTGDGVAGDVDSVQRDAADEVDQVDAGDDSATGDAEADGDDGPGAGNDDAASRVDMARVEIDGTVYELTNVFSCDIGHRDEGTDFRSFHGSSAGGGGAFPVFQVFHGAESQWISFEPDADSYFGADFGGFAATVTEDGLVGSATLIGEGEADPGEVDIEFEVSCPSVIPVDEVDDVTGDEDASDGADDSDEREITGTVIVAGVTHQLSGPARPFGDYEDTDHHDFEICETVNPAFVGDFNVGGTLNDGTRFHLIGNVDDDFEDNGFTGFFYGDTWEEERAENFEVSLDGRTLSGTGTFSVGVVEFSFTC